MFWKEHGEKIKGHLTAFHDQYVYFKGQEPELNLHKYAEEYIKNEVAMEAGMQEYFDGLNEVAEYNNRILRAIKSVKGKRFYYHLKRLMKDCEAVHWDNWQILSAPTGEIQRERDYGRHITRVWCEQWATGTEGDSWDGYICVEIKPNKYLKFRFSC